MASKEIDTHSGGAVEKANSDGSAKKSWIAKIVLFVQQIIAELKKVTTPTKKELINFTLVVIAFVAIMMAIVWLLDQFFGWLVLFIFGTRGF